MQSFSNKPSSSTARDDKYAKVDRYASTVLTHARTTAHIASDLCGIGCQFEQSNTTGPTGSSKTATGMSNMEDLLEETVIPKKPDSRNKVVPWLKPNACSVQVCRQACRDLSSLTLKRGCRTCSPGLLWSAGFPTLMISLHIAGVMADRRRMTAKGLILIAYW
jgi:hypothetical protein